MNRDAAIAQIMRDLGNRTGTYISTLVLDKLIEAQVDLESGKTLPKFLLVEDAALVLSVGTFSTALPTGFIRWTTKPHYTPTGEDEPFFIEPKVDYESALKAQSQTSRTGPQVFVIRQSTINFITTADVTYNLVWSYYAHAQVLSSNVENAWLGNQSGGAQWLIGEAGWRSAMVLRDADAITIFDRIRTSGRAACFGETIAAEDSMGPIIMGANL